jgi:hypothetical protein
MAFQGPELTITGRLSKKRLFDQLRFVEPPKVGRPGSPKAKNLLGARYREICPTPGAETPRKILALDPNDLRPPLFERFWSYGLSV